MRSFEQTTGMEDSKDFEGPMLKSTITPPVLAAVVTPPTHPENGSFKKAFGILLGSGPLGMGVENGG